MWVYAWDMLFCLLLAGVLGGFSGWLARALYAARRLSFVQRAFEGRLRRVAQEATDLRVALRQREATQVHQGDVEAQVSALLSRLGEAEKTRAAAQGEVGALRRQLVEVRREAEGELRRLHQLVQEAEAERDAKARALDATEGRVREVSGRLDERERTVRTTEGRDPETEGEVERLILRVREQTLRLEAQKIRNAELSGEAAVHEAAMAQKDEEITRLSTRVAELDGVNAELLVHKARMRELDFRLQVLTESRDGEISRLLGRVGELEALAGQLHVRDVRIAELEARMAALRTEWDAEVARLVAHIAELEPHALRGIELAARAQAIEGRVTRLAEAKDAEIARLQIQIDELSPLPGQLQERDARLAALLARQQDAAATLAARDEVVAGLRAQIAELESRPPAPAPAVDVHDESDLPEALAPGIILPGGLSHAPDEADDLKLIWGIGPVLERLLNSLGIYTFRQIAGWTEEDLQVVEGHLTAFRNRIRRDDWVGGAREHHERKYGQPPSPPG